MKRTALILVFTTATLLLAFTLQARQLYRTLPQTDGVIRVAGTKEPIGITRDEAAVPHIFAANQQDAWFGLGFVHAQDRMWQMDMSRRIVAGRVSELVGKSGLSVDRFVRTAGLYDAAARSLPSLSVETRGLLDAYTTGVNSAITQSRGELSPEFQLFGVELAPWTPEDSLAVFKMLAVGLSGNMYGELRRLQLMTQLSQEQINQFAPPYPGDEPEALPSLEDLYEGAVQAKDQVAITIPFEGPVEASNNWVVDGTRTKSGMPLLSNDPHLAFNAPGIWYLAHLSVGSGDERRNIIGGSMAGIPAILTGRTDTIAWGVTNTGPDTQDLYLERINPDNPAQYQTPDGWANFETREEKIKVRFGKDVTLKIRSTRHGPVLPQEMADTPFSSESYVLALQWTALTVPDISVDAQVKPLNTRNWREFNDAFADFTGPMQSFVYADIDGNIGFVAPAHVPVRGPNHQTKGLLPAPGWRAENDWQGLIAFDELPRITNPPSGRIATANSKVTPEGYGPFITAEWSEPLRTRQIEKRLDAVTKHDVRSFQSMHLDNTSQIAQTLLPHLMATPAQSKSELKVLNLLDGWDGDMRADGPEGLVYSVWAHNLSRALYADDLGDLYANYTKIRPAFLTSVLSGNQDLAYWCDDDTTETTETCDDILAKALTDAATQLVKNYGETFENENWGDHHKVIHTHQAFSAIPFLRNLANIETPTGGGPFTPNQGGYRYTSKANFQNRHGAGYRGIYDFADMNASLFIQTTGQSGNILSDHYRDLAPRWQVGALLPMTTDPDPTEAGVEGTLALVP